MSVAAYQFRPDLLGLVAGGEWTVTAANGSNGYTEIVAYTQLGTPCTRRRDIETRGASITYTAKCTGFDIHALPKLNAVIAVSPENQAVCELPAQMIVVSVVLTTGHGQEASVAYTLDTYTPCSAEEVAPIEKGFVAAETVVPNRLAYLLDGLTNATGSAITGATYTLANLEPYTNQTETGTSSKGGKSPQVSAVLTVQACSDLTTSPKPTGVNWTIDAGTFNGALRKFVEYTFNAFKFVA